MKKYRFKAECLRCDYSTFIQHDGKEDYREVSVCPVCNGALVDVYKIGKYLKDKVGSGDFGWALHQLKNGHRVARAGWNGEGMFIYLVNGNNIPIESLRKEAFEHVAKTQTKDNVREITINSHIDMKAADGSVVVGWLASQTDMLAGDWMIV